MLNEDTLPSFQAAIRDAGLDGWLLFDFRGTNPIAGGLLGFGQLMLTRRIFVWVPREGTPVAVTHAIEQAPWARWPAAWRKEVYSSWRTLEAAVGALVAGKRVAMEYSPGDAEPYVDRVPTAASSMRHELYTSLRHAAGHRAHGACSMACVTATGVPSRGTHTKMRRVSITCPKPSSPPAIGLVPRKSYSSQPSRPASAIAAWKRGRDDSVSMT